MKGQYFSFDAIIGSVIFVLALVALLSYWYSVKSYLDGQNNDLSSEAVRLSEIIFTPATSAPGSSGYALSWDDKRLNESLLQSESMLGSEGSEAALKTRLATAYDVTLNITQINADGGTDTIDIGSAPSSSTTQIVNLYREATLVDSNGATHLAQIQITLYQ